MRSVHAALLMLMLWDSGGLPLSLCLILGAPGASCAVIEGMDVVYKVEAVGSPSGKPSKKVVITKSGELPTEDAPAKATE
jgi:hypothetical protein